ncbi:MAG: M23 family peptidase [Acidobacteria bacterium]|nr:MAG: M23 family peptidase [Acidobacteriota bacterium]
MKPMSLLLLIFLSACGLVHVEIRDRETKKKRKEEIVRQERVDIKLPLPVKGKPEKTERGYYIKSSCDEFFRSISDGRVLYSGNDIKGYGWVVMVESEEGYIIVYAKADSTLVRRGEAIRRNQVLGKVGKGGEDCGILFEVRDREGKPISFTPVL